MHDLRPGFIRDQSEGTGDELEELQSFVRDWRRSKVANPMTRYQELRNSRSMAIGPDSCGFAATTLLQLHLSDLVVGEDAQCTSGSGTRRSAASCATAGGESVPNAISAVAPAVRNRLGKLAGEHECNAGESRAWRGAVRSYDVKNPIARTTFLGRGGRVGLECSSVFGPGQSPVAEPGHTSDWTAMIISVTPRSTRSSTDLISPTSCAFITDWLGYGRRVTT